MPAEGHFQASRSRRYEYGTRGKASPYVFVHPSVCNMHPFHSSPRDRIDTEDGNRCQPKDAENNGLRSMVHRRCRCSRASEQSKRAVGWHPHGGVPYIRRHVLCGNPPLEYVNNLSVFRLLIYLLCCRCGRRAGYHAQHIQRSMHRKGGASRRGEAPAPRRRKRAAPSNQPSTGGGGTSSNRKSWKSHQARPLL